MSDKYLEGHTEDEIREELEIRKHLYEQTANSHRGLEDYAEETLWEELKRRHCARTDTLLGDIFGKLQDEHEA